MRHLQERRDNQTGFGVLAWADLQLPPLKSTFFCFFVELFCFLFFASDPLKDCFIYFFCFWLQREGGRGTPSLPVCLFFLFVFVVFFVFVFLDADSFFYACREKSVVTPDRLASPRTLTRELQANQGGRERKREGVRGRVKTDTRSMLGLCCWFCSCACSVCVLLHSRGLLPSQSHGPLRRLREAYPGPLSAQRAGQSLARQMRAVLRVQVQFDREVFFSRGQTVLQKWFL